VERPDIETARWIIKTAVWIITALTFAGTEGFEGSMILPLLLCVAADIADIRFFRSAASALVKSALFILVASRYPPMTLFVASGAFDLSFQAPLPLIAVPFIALAFLVPVSRLPVMILLTLFAAVAGHIAQSYHASLIHHTSLIDAERASRHRLEETGRRLETTSRALVEATRRAEQNRIAHAIHDDVGHRLTGILMQLQGAQRLLVSQPDRCSRMLDTSVSALTETVASVRETVHDLRPRPESDAAALRLLASEFRFCPVDISLDDKAFSTLPERLRETSLSVVRELLTNAARHSRAQKIEIRIEIDMHLRIIYSDDGLGSGRIIEGMGLRGIRQRVETYGGTVAVSGYDGFALRCAIPMECKNE
jgi:signal transduction histidine kinase